MTYLASGRDPLNGLQWLSRTKRFPFVAKIPEDQNWSQFRMAIVRQLEDYFTGMFDVQLGDESKLTTDSAEFVLYVEIDEIDKAQEYLKRYQISG